MAIEKKRVLGQLAAYEVAMVARMLGSGQVDPDSINPFAVKPRMSAANRRLLERDQKETVRAAHRRHERKGRVRKNVRHYPIGVKQCQSVQAEAAHAT